MDLQWKASNTAEAERVGILEFEVDGEWHNFEVLDLDDRLLFGGVTNIGFIESGYILKDGFNIDEVLQTLLEELKIYYTNGKEFVTEIVFNERM